MKEIITKYIKYVLLVLALIIGLIMVYKTTKKEQEDTVQLEPLVTEIETIEETKIEELEKIKVDIKGEIINPGVYELDKGSRVSDAIEKSGGLTENADTTLLNLSKNLKDEMVIVIYNKNEIEKLKKDLTTTKTVIEYIEKECTCPDTINDACIKEENTKEEKTKEEKKEDKEEIETRISINKATIEELETLPSIGKTKAKAIIEYREKNGEFKDIKDITNVSGIGESTFEKFKEFITL